MKYAALILLCAFALANTEDSGIYPNGCPKDWSVEQLLPHPNCRKFYQCWDGELVEHSCPAHLYFSVERNRCEWSEVIDCSATYVPEKESDEADNNNVGAGNCDPSKAPEICAAEGSESVLVAHEKCNKYYICHNGVPVPRKCQVGLLFNPNTDQCDWPENVDCGDRVIPDGNGNNDNNNENNGNGDNDTGSTDNGGSDSDNQVVGGGNCDPSQAPEICAAEGSESVLVAHEKCNKYYICHNGVPVPRRCQVGLLFNPNTDQCDWPENVDCGDRVIPDGNGNNDNNNENNGNGDNDTGSTDNGGSDSDNQVVGGGNCDPSQAPEICAAEGSESVLVAHEKCNKYYICHNGVPVPRRCQAGLLFNPNTDQCDWPENVDCGDRVVPDGNGNNDNNNENNGNGDNDTGSTDNGDSDSDNQVVGGGNCDPSQAPEICAAEGSESVLVAHEKCNKYYICHNGVPVPRRCQVGLLFNPNTDQCDWPENVDCGDRVIPDGNGNNDNNNENNGNGDNDTGSTDNGGSDSDNQVVGGGNCDPSQAPEICAAEGSESVLVAHEKCNKYYICHNGVPVPRRCQVGLLFNPNTDQCDWPENVDCGDRVIPDGNGNNDNNNENNGNGDNDTGSTDNGGSDSDNQVVGGGNCDPSQAPEICAAEGSESVLVAHEKCNKYYICHNGVPVPRRCQVGLLFNPNTDQCDWPENVDCGDRVIPDGNGNNDNNNENNGNGDNDTGSTDNGDSDSDNQVVGGGNCDPSQAPEICAAEGSESVLVAHEKCNKYYICHNGVPVPRRCQVGLLFNPNTDQCDWPENVDCGDRVIPDGNGNNDNNNENNGNGDNDTGSTDNGDSDSDNQVVGGGNCDPSQAPEICAVEGSDGVLIAHEKCNKYYICIHGVPLPRPCSAGLFFNPNTDQCDWLENVDCGDRVIPGGESGGNGNGDNDNNENNGNGGSDNGGTDNGGSDNDNQVVGGGNCDPSQAPEICATEGSDSVLIAHEKCNKYYICVHGAPHPRPCSAGLFFNPDTNQCDWPENVDCGDRVIPDGGSSDNGNGDNESTGNGGSDNGGSDNGGGENDNQVVGGGFCDPSQAPEICAAEGSDGVLIAHEKCNKYYICVHGVPLSRPCSAGLFFNPNTDQCDWLENVDCGDRVIPDGDSGGNGNCDNDSNENNENGGSNNGGTDNGGSDNDNQVVGGGNCDPSQAPEICATEGSDSVLIAHEKCNKYYICIHGVPVPRPCQAGLFFNPNTDQCDWPENVDCGDRVIPDGGTSDNGNGDSESTGNGGSDNGGSDNGGGDNDNQVVGGGNCDPSQAPEICAAEGSDSVLIAHEKCNKYYICVQGLPVPRPCQAGLFFNPNTDQCDWPESVDCGDRVIPDGDNESENGNSNDNNGNGDGDNDGGDNESQNVGECNCNPNEAPEICAAEGSDNVLVAHEKCNKFFICNYGIPITVGCPAGLLYNPIIEHCDWPQNVDCGDRVIPDGNEDNNGNENGGNDSGSDNNGGSDGDDQNVGECNCNPNEAPEICAAAESNNVFVAHEKCNKFFVCNNGVPVTLQCPAGLLYNPYKEECDWPQNVDCGDRVIPEGDNEDENGNENGSNDNGSDNNGGSDGDNQGVGECNCNPNEAPEICAAEGSDNVFVAHEKCNKFFVCNNGIPVILRCPAGLLYNPYKEQCDWPQNVDCGDRVIPDDNEDNNVNENGGNDSGSDNNGGSDGDNQGVGECNCNPNEAPEICAAEGSNNVFVAHEKCNKFFICNHGIPITQRCPAGLLYNPYKEQCDWPQNVDCGDRVIPEGNNEDDNSNENGSNDNGSDNNGGSDGDNQGVGECNCDPNKAPEICAAEGSDNVFVAHEKCNKFFVCNNGIPVILRCPAGLLYNPYKEQCDWPQNVNCGDRVIPEGDNEDENGNENGSNDNGSDNNGGSDGDNQGVGECNCNPNEAPEICAAEGSNNVFVAHEKCNKFFVCNNGIPVILRCPAGLLYNPYKEQCDWPQNVDCGDRVIPDGDNDDNGYENGGNDNNGGSDGDGQNVGECNCNPNEAPQICAADRSNNVLVAHEKCNKYYVCASGKPVTFRCPANLLYNPYIEQCDWPENVDCTDKINTDVQPDDENDNSEDGAVGGGNNDPSLAPIICADEKATGVFVAHEICTKFYTCSNGKPITLRCPANLFFNPSTDQCDWPLFVNCEGRLIPSEYDVSLNKHMEARRKLMRLFN